MTYWITKRESPHRQTKCVVGYDGSVQILQTVEVPGHGAVARDVVLNADEWDRVQAIRNAYLAKCSKEVDS